MTLDVEGMKSRIKTAARPFFRGSVDIVSGVLVEARGVPAALGEVCRIERGKAGAIEAEVVGFRGDSTLLMPHGDLRGIAPAQPVYALGRPFAVEVSDELLGRMVDGFGRPMDDGPALLFAQRRPARREAPGPCWTCVRKAMAVSTSPVWYSSSQSPPSASWPVRSSEAARSAPVSAASWLAAACPRAPSPKLQP